MKWLLLLLFFARKWWWRLWLRSDNFYFSIVDGWFKVNFSFLIV